MYLQWLLPLLGTVYLVYRLFVAPRFSPLRKLPGPPVPGFFANHLQHVLNPTVTPRVHEIFAQRYGHSVRIRALGPWDDRLLTLDPVSLGHIMKNTSIYEKPWQSRKLITSLIGCGMLSAEGLVHKRQRRVALPAFSGQNMRSLVEISFNKGMQLKDVWVALLSPETDTARIDVCQFLSRATFDVIGLAGFDYNFNSIKDESNQLFVAYRDMFEIVISQASAFRTLLSIYLPRINQLFPDRTVYTVRRCQEVIHRVAGRLIQEKKQKILEGEKNGDPYDGKDLLTLMLKSNAAVDLQPEQRLSDEDILNNINTFMFAGSDTSSLSMTWTFYLLAQNSEVQDRLRAELMSIGPEFPRTLSELSDDEVHSLHAALANLPLLQNVMRESLRLLPPLHSTLRVATQDDQVPTLYPVHHLDGQTTNSVTVPKGTVVHIPFEAFNVDKSIWGQDAWDFDPDRWDSLPEAVKEYPWHFSSLLSFSTGPRACPGLRFALVEMRCIYYVLLTNFVFRETEDKITKHNVVLTRPYLTGKFKDGTQCPLSVSRFIR